MIKTVLFLSIMILVGCKSKMEPKVKPKTESKEINKVLRKKKYKRIKLRRMETKHLELIAKINGVKGRFILDTGATNTCIGLDLADYFKVSSQESEVKASGAGATDMETHISKYNKIKIGKWKTKDLKLILFDLGHVNTALESNGERKIHGIIGADILELGKAVIDYENKYLYLIK